MSSVSISISDPDAYTGATDSMAASLRHKSATLLPVGTKVTLLFGVTRRIGTIVEHRGPIGKEGERLYRVEFPNGDETFYTELAASDFDTTL